MKGVKIMNITIVDAKCPVCGSDHVRSKVGDENNVWWFICDNPDCSNMIVVDRKLVEIENRFYFTNPGDYDHVYIEYTNKADGKSNTAYKKGKLWHTAN